jgi:valyl-tRNA synthetase
MINYKLFWDEFSGWYFEIIKPEYQKPVDRKTFDATLTIFDKLLRITHPFMPFITEEIWQLLVERKEGESLMVTMMPEARKYDSAMISGFEVAKETISALRTVRKEKEIPIRESMSLMIKSEMESFDKRFLPVMTKLCKLDEIKFVSEKQAGSASFMVGTTEFYVPLGSNINIEEEIEKIHADLDYNIGFLASVMKKLDNERFVQNAPSTVLDLEKRKKADAESKISSLEERLKELKK